MRLLRSIHSANPATGGTIESVRVMSLALERLGHNVEVLSCDAPDAPFVANFPLPLHAIGPGRPGYGSSKAFDAWLDVNLPRFDAVIIEGLWLYNGLGVMRALKRMGRKAPPYFVYPHGMLDPWFKGQYPLKHFKKLVYWQLFEKQLLNGASRVIFTTEEEQKLAQNTFPGFAAKTEVVPLGIEPPPGDLDACQFAFYEAFPVLKGQPFILFLGRLHEKKGLDMLLEAHARQPAEPQLVIAGTAASAEEEKRWRTLAEELAISTRVHFTGHLGGAPKWGALAAAEAFVLPSHQENFGVAVVEALACGTPVLISDQINIWQPIREAGAAIVEAVNLAGTENLLALWQSLDQDQRRAIGYAAQQLYKDRYAADAAARELLSVLQD